MEVVVDILILLWDMVNNNSSIIVEWQVPEQVQVYSGDFFLG